MKKITKTKDTPNVDTFKLEGSEPETFHVNTDFDRPTFIPPVEHERVISKEPVRAAKPDAKEKEFKPVTTVTETENGKITHISTVHTINAKRG